MMATLPSPSYPSPAFKSEKKPITLAMTYRGAGKDPWGNVKAGFSLTGKVNRKDHNVSWSKAMDNGGAVVGEVVQINIAGEVGLK